MTRPKTHLPGARSTVQRIAAAAACAWGLSAAHAAALNVLMVLQNSTISGTESGVKSTIEGWGHTVTTIVDSASQTSFNTAMAAVDVVYIPVLVDDWEIAAKCKTTTKGVLCEERYIDDDMGFSTATGWDASHTQTQILINTHDITSGLSTGYVTITSSATALSMMNATVASGMTILSKQNYTAGNMLGVIDVGGSLADGSSCLGRRVRMPWGGDSLNYAALNSTAVSIFQKALIWAGSKPGARYAFDETSGTSVADSSGHAYTATITGTPTWSVAARRNTGLKFSASGTTDMVTIPNSALSGASNLTVGFWIRTSASSDQTVLSVANSTNFNKLKISFTNATTMEISLNDVDNPITIASIATNSWTHFAVVISTTTTKIYRDGALINTISAGTGGAMTVQGLVVGQDQDSLLGGYDAAQRLIADLDDLAIYGSAYTDAQVAELYGLIAHWKLDETSGATAADASLAANSATRTGTAGWTGGLDGNGHDFVYVGGEEYFTAPTNSALNDVQEDDYTLMAYFLPHSIPPGTGSAYNAYYGIIRKPGYHCGLAYDNTGSFVVEHWAGSTPTWYGAYSGTSTNALGRFYHVASVVSKKNGTIKIYVDGVLKATSTFTAGTAAYEYGTVPWRVGISNPGGGAWGQPSDAIIDDARIYNRALADEEITAIAKTGLRGHWKLDETSGTALADSSDNSASAAFATGTPARIAAVRDNGLTFSGANSAATSANFDPIPQGAVAFWFKPSAAPAATNRLLGTSDTWEVRLESNGTINCDMGAATGVASTSTFTSTTKWRHVVFNYNSIVDTYEMYIDGALEKSGSLTASDEAAAILSFGTRTGTTNYFAGSMDDVRIYGRPLTGSEIADIYGLVGHWKLDAGSGSSLTDSSLMSNTAAFNTGTPAWVTAVRGKGLDFDGTNDAITSSSFTPPAEGTVAFWYRCDSVGASQRILGNGGDWEIRQYPDGYMYFDLCADSNGAAGCNVTDKAFTASTTWYHVAVTFDSDDNTYAIYLNGDLHKTGTSPTDLIQQPSGQLSLGNRTGTTERFAGALDDVRIYNRKLSAAEIYEVFGLLGWYKLDETSGTVAADSTGLGNSGTFVGSPTLGATANGLAAQGTAIALSGSNNVQVSGPFDKSAVVSASAWIRLDGADTNGAEVVSLGDNFAIRLNYPTSNAIAAFYYNGTAWTGAYASYALKGSGWHHVAAALRGGDTLVLYLDGNQVSSVSAAAAISYSAGGTNTLIGAHGNSQTTYDFTGRVDDVRIYNRTLLPDEVFNQYRGSRINGVKILKWLETR